MDSDRFVRRVVRAAAVLRLGAVAIALIGLTGRMITLPLVIAVLALGALGIGQLVQPSVSDLMARHPVVIAVDVLVTFAVLAALGVDTPLVLATFSTALVIGLLLPTAFAAVAGVILVAGYVIAARLGPPSESSFLVEIGLPAVYVMLLLIGGVVRFANDEQRRARARLAVAEQAAAAAEERTRLAREMHDSLGKSLHGLALAAAALPGWIQQDPEVASVRASELAEGTRHAVEQARGLLTQMRDERPAGTFAEVVADVCAQWSAGSGVPTVVDVPVGCAMAPDQLREVTAIVSEALENVGRHAHASHVAVGARGRPGNGFTLEIADDGTGFDPDRVPRSHYGITGMRERAVAIGGTVSVHSAPGRGTTVRLVQSRSVVTV